MSTEFLTSLITILLLLLLGFAILRSALRIVPQQKSWIVERLGRFHRALSPGLNVLVPFMDRVAYRFDLREMPSEVPAQVCISLDNTTLTVDGFLYLQITDAVKAAYGSSNPMNAALQLAQTSMRSERSASYISTKPCPRGSCSMPLSLRRWKRPLSIGGSRSSAMRSKTSRHRRQSCMPWSCRSQRNGKSAR